jgi:hypothetical protein
VAKIIIYSHEKMIKIMFVLAFTYPEVATEIIQAVSLSGI